MSIQGFTNSRLHQFQIMANLPEGGGLVWCVSLLFPSSLNDLAGMPEGGCLAWSSSLKFPSFNHLAGKPEEGGRVWCNSKQNSKQIKSWLSFPWLDYYVIHLAYLPGGGGCHGGGVLVKATRLIVPRASLPSYELSLVVFHCSLSLTLPRSSGPAVLCLPGLVALVAVYRCQGWGGHWLV